MSEEPKREDPEELSVPEKILRVQDLWDEIAKASEDVELTPRQVEEAERRLRQHDESPGQYPTWDELRRRLGGAR